MALPIRYLCGIALITSAVQYRQWQLVPTGLEGIKILGNIDEFQTVQVSTRGTRRIRAINLVAQKAVPSCCIFFSMSPFSYSVTVSRMIIGLVLLAIGDPAFRKV